MRRTLVLASVLLFVAGSAAHARTAQQPAPVGSATFVVTGHGWGHGRGMGQWGAYGYAQAGWSAAQILDHFYGGTTAGSAGNPNLSVRLSGFPADLLTQQEKGHL